MVETPDVDLDIAWLRRTLKPWALGGFKVSQTWVCCTTIVQRFVLGFMLRILPMVDDQGIWDRASHAGCASRPARDLQTLLSSQEARH